MRGANVTDAKAIDSLIADPRRRALMKEAFDEATGPLASEPDARRTKSVYVAECVGQPVGLVIMDDECDVEQLQSQYALEDYVLFSEHAADAHTYLHTFVVNPRLAMPCMPCEHQSCREHPTVPHGACRAAR